VTIKHYMTVDVVLHVSSPTEIEPRRFRFASEIVSKFFEHLPFSFSIGIYHLYENIAV